MNTRSSISRTRFSAALQALHECASPPDLGPALLRSMQKLLDADVYAINWFDVEKILDVSYYAGRSGEVALENSCDILNSHLHEHPLLPIADG
jgi:hypothetical protein